MVYKHLLLLTLLATSCGTATHNESFLSSTDSVEKISNVVRVNDGGGATIISIDTAVVAQQSQNENAKSATVRVSGTYESNTCGATAVAVQLSNYQVDYEGQKKKMALNLKLVEVHKGESPISINSRMCSSSSSPKSFQADLEFSALVYAAGNANPQEVLVNVYSQKSMNGKPAAQIKVNFDSTNLSWSAELVKANPIDNVSPELLEKIEKLNAVPESDWAKFLKTFCKAPQTPQFVFSPTAQENTVKLTVRNLSSDCIETLSDPQESTQFSGLLLMETMKILPGSFLGLQDPIELLKD